MGHPVNQNGKQPRIGKQDFLLRCRRRVAVKGCLQIQLNLPCHLRQFFHHLLRQLRGPLRILRRQRKADLPGHLGLDALQQQRSVVLRRQAHQFRFPEIGRENQPSDFFNQ